ncbi:MAG: Acylphosphatase [Opitutia bacterium UBA7350]|nr:MAG: Acylphosphatase [Opitutae bacterium UBA7350]
MEDNVFHLNAWFEGHVQGVGFRYQAVQVAKAYEVGGIVRNLVDGRVHLLAEGVEEEVRAFVAEVQDELWSYIKKVETKSGAGPRKCKGFTIATTDG